MLRSGNLTFYPFVRCQNMIFKDFRPLEMYGFWLRLMEFIFTKIWPSKLSVFCFCKEMLRIGALCVIPISWSRQRLWKVCQWRFFFCKKIILSCTMCLMYDSALSQVEQSKNMKFFVKSIVKAQQLQFDE